MGRIKKDFIDILNNTDSITLNTNEKVVNYLEEQYRKKIDYYEKESLIPVEKKISYTKADKHRYKKWLREKRRRYIKYFKDWGPWDTSSLYEPMKMLLEDMFEFYKDDIWVWGAPLGEDTRKSTLAKTLALLETAEYEREYRRYDDAIKKFKIAFSYMADHMEEWWD